MCDDAHDVVCDVMSDVVCDGVHDGVCDVVDGGVIGGEGTSKVEWLILSCLGVLVTDRQTDERTNGRTDIGGCRVAFATEKHVDGLYIELCFTQYSIKVYEYECSLWHKSALTWWWVIKLWYHFIMEAKLQQSFKQKKIYLLPSLPLLNETNWKWLVNTFYILLTLKCPFCIFYLSKWKFQKIS